MKKLFKSLFAVLLLAVVLNIGLNSVSEAKSEMISQKTDLVIVRTQEGDKNFIEIYTDSGIFITKFEEL